MKRSILAVLIACFFAAIAFAQTSSQNLVGTVSDASGVIPNATVVVKDNQSGKERTVQTTDQGGFTVPNLIVGTYTVTVTSAGHKTFTAAQVKIDAGKEYSLPILMAVGEVSENVTVVAGTDVINTTNAELSTNIGPRQLLELPLLTRNPLALILTSAGTASNPAQNTTIKVNAPRPRILFATALTSTTISFDPTQPTSRLRVLRLTTSANSPSLHRTQRMPVSAQPS
jgi:hypothetical protein